MIPVSGSREGARAIIGFWLRPLPGQTGMGAGVTVTDRRELIIGFLALSEARRVADPDLRHGRRPGQVEGTTLSPVSRRPAGPRCGTGERSFGRCAGDRIRSDGRPGWTDDGCDAGRGTQFGPSGLKAIRAVLPSDLRVYAVGGVDPQNLGRWRAAGASGFGIGSAIFKPGQSAHLTGLYASAFRAAWMEPASPEAGGI